jgi:Cytochrome P460
MRALGAVTLALAVLAAGCGGSSEPEAAAPTATVPETVSTEHAATTTAPTPEPPKAEPKPLPGLPAFTAGYEQWTRLTRKPVPPRESGDAHLGTKRIFASQERRANGVFPDGTIIVKEAARPGADFMGLIAVMRKEPGADPVHNDWRFIEWTRDDPNERFTLQARDSVCWNCHVGAEQTDYVWVYTLGLGR